MGHPPYRSGFRLWHFNLRNDIATVIIENLDRLDRAFAIGEVSRQRDFFDLLYLRSKQSRFAETDLEAVMIRRIMRTGDHDPAIDVFREHGVIENRRRYHSYQHDIESALVESTRQQLAKPRRAFPCVIADGDPPRTILREERPDGAPERRDRLIGQLITDYSSNVVFPEDVCIHKPKLAKSAEIGNVDVFFLFVLFRVIRVIRGRALFVTK